MAKRKISSKIINQTNKLKQSILADKVPITAIYLYGSFAKGRSGKWSDIDLCVISPAFGKSIKDPLNYLWSKRLILNDFKIEPIGFSPQDFKQGSPLIAEIKKYGIRVV